MQASMPIWEKFGAEPFDRGRDELAAKLRERGLPETIHGVVQTGSGQSKVMEAPMGFNPENPNGDGNPLVLTRKEIDELMGLDITQGTPVEGHDMGVMIGPLQVAGADQSINYMVFQGRRHPYEGLHPVTCVAHMLVGARMGASELWGANASGIVTPDTIPQGTLTLVMGDLDMARGIDNPVRFLKPGVFGSRFPGNTQRYTPETRELIKREAERLGMNLPETVYIRNMGPAYESEDEIYELRRLLRGLWQEGAAQKDEDRYSGPVRGVVGMSSVNEVSAMKLAGVRSVAFFSAAGNLGANLGKGGINRDQLDHARDVEATVAVMNESLGKILIASMIARQRVLAIKQRLQATR